MEPASERPLGGAEEQDTLLMESAADSAICFLDRDGQVAARNTGAERILGYAEEEIAGQHFSRFFIPEEVERGEPEKELRTAAGPGRVSGDRWHVRKDGTRFWAGGV